MYAVTSRSGGGLHRCPATARRHTPSCGGGGQSTTDRRSNRRRPSDLAFARERTSPAAASPRYSPPRATAAAWTVFRCLPCWSVRLRPSAICTCRWTTARRGSRPRSQQPRRATGARLRLMARQSRRAAGGGARPGLPMPAATRGDRHTRQRMASGSGRRAGHRGGVPPPAPPIPCAPRPPGPPRGIGRGIAHAPAAAVARLDGGRPGRHQRGGTSRSCGRRLADHRVRQRGVPQRLGKQGNAIADATRRPAALGYARSARSPRTSCTTRSGFSPRLRDAAVEHREAHGRATCTVRHFSLRQGPPQAR